MPDSRGNPFGYTGCEMEPWLKGSIVGIHPIQTALLYSFEHARQDIVLWTEDLTTEQLWRRSGEVAPVGFHVLHMVGSIDRLLTYAGGGQLSGEQMRALRAEQETTDLPREELLHKLEEGLRAAEILVRALDVTNLAAVREIGRKRVEVPLGVLLTHIAEHTQRHMGAAIVTTKVVREGGPKPPASVT